MDESDFDQAADIHAESPLYQAIRVQTYGQDIGQRRWLTVDEHATFITWLRLNDRSRVLEVACGSGGPTLHMVSATGCHAVGIDIEEQRVRAAHLQAKRLGVGARALFARADADTPLPYEGNSFDAVICIDAINYLANRTRSLADWWRVLKPGGRVLFTDPVVVAGPVTAAEIAERSASPAFVYVPLGYDDRCIAEAGFELRWCEDVTANAVAVARRWYAARATYADALRELEGDGGYDARQHFLSTTERLGAERRICRMVYLVERPEA